MTYEQWTALLYPAAARAFTEVAAEHSRMYSFTCIYIGMRA